MEQITLDLIPSGVMQILHASQYDINRSYHVDITEGGTPYKLDGTETLTINERKGDNCICTLDVTNTFADKTYIEFSSTEQMCAVWGSNLCELRIIKGGVDLGTLNFILEVEPSPIEGGIQSESEINNLNRQIDERVDEDVEGRLDDYATKEWVGEECYDKTYIDNAFTGVNNSLNNKMDKNNPTGTGSFKINVPDFYQTGSKAVAINGEAKGYSSVSLGGSNHANANYSVATGYGTTADGQYSNASGYSSVASGDKSHAEGDQTTALGDKSHAEGDHTCAYADCQHVCGRYNEYDYERKYAEIVGNGTSGGRSNARTLDWQGNETLAGDLVYNGNKSITSEVQRLDDKIDALPEAMVFKGTLGVNGDIQTLPTASAEIEGWTFKCITAGTYSGLTLKVGDTVTCFNPPNTSVYEWDISGYGDTDTDTWRAIKVEGVEKLGNGISSGAVDFRGSANIDVTFDADGNKVEIATKNIYTQTEVNNLVAQAIVDILPTETKSGSVANFETDLELPYQLAKFGIVATQEAGTPTPSSPKAISGWSQIVATQADSNMTSVEQITIALGDTYYGGYVEVDKDGHRRLVVTYRRLELSTLTDWSRITNYTNPFFRATLPEDCKVRTASNNPQIAICDSYAWYSSNQNYWQYIGNGEFVTAGFGVSSVNRVYIRNDDYTDKNTFVSSLSGVYIVYELAEPIIIDIHNGEPITALNGVNNVFCDSGDTEVTYKLSINKALSNLGGGNRSVNLAKSVEEEVKEEEPKDEPETRQER